MTFTDLEKAEHLRVIEECFWSRRRPPLHLRDRVREGQRLTDQAVELFVVRPAFEQPGVEVEESIAKVQYVRSQDVWRLFWKRADGKWHGYQPRLEMNSLAEALRVIDEDACQCFFG